MTPTKKKLVYKQDPDGVFRLKKLGDDDKLSTKSDKRTVDDYLNDLISCAYQVVDPNKPVEVESVKSGGSEQTSDVNITDGIEDLHSDHAPKLRVNTQAIQSPTPNQSPVKEVSRSPVVVSRSPVRQTSPQQYSKEPSPGLNIAVAPVATTNSLQKLAGGALMFHIPSFGLGLIIAIIISQCWSQIAFYGTIAFNYLKIGLIWALVLGVIGWYSGLIKIQNIAVLRLLSNRFVPVSTVSPAVISPELVQGETEVPVAIPEYDEYAEIERQERRRPRMKSRSKGMDPREREFREREREREFRDHREPRKNTVTNVMPFKPHPRTEYKNERSNSVPNMTVLERGAPKLNRYYSSDPKSNYNKFVERTKKHKPANSLDSFDSSALKYPNNNQVEFPVVKNTLPSLPDEDLPFVNEVKLYHGDEIGELPGFGVQRLNTTNSKRSVLGTRANYNKFLENAHYE